MIGRSNDPGSRIRDSLCLEPHWNPGEGEDPIPELHPERLNARLYEALRCSREIPYDSVTSTLLMGFETDSRSVTIHSTYVPRAEKFSKMNHSSIDD